jgi:hypothetical protein
MRRNNTNSSNGRPGVLVSRTAILILSGVLIGNGIGNGVMSGLHFYGFCAGLIGLISFFALDVLAHQRQLLKTRRRTESVTRVLDRRIRRHVARHQPTEDGLLHPTRRRESSFLPVTCGKW